jgi:Mg/Co/Ni transporter MgtE
MIERKIAQLQRQSGQFDSDDDDKYRSKSGNDGIMKAVIDRGGWLVGLLVVQSCSSFILAEYESLLHKHPTIGRMLLFESTVLQLTFTFSLLPYYAYWCWR